MNKAASLTILTTVTTMGYLLLIYEGLWEVALGIAISGPITAICIDRYLKGNWIWEHIRHRRRNREFK